jgi:hypothetical protein
MDVRADGSTGIEFTDAEFLMYRSIRPIHNAPAAETTADLCKGRGNLEIFLIGSADDMSRWHEALLYGIVSSPLQNETFLLRATAPESQYRALLRFQYYQNTDISLSPITRVYCDAMTTELTVGGRDCLGSSTHHVMPEFTSNHLSDFPIKK